jgi:cytidylate kinase
MSIVALFPDTLMQGRELAMQLATRTGYTYRTAEDILGATAEKHNRPRSELAKALEPIPFPWHRALFTQRTKDRLMLEQEVSSLICRDNLIFQGFLGYPLFREVSHALRVRIFRGPVGAAQTPQGRSEVPAQEVKLTRKWVWEVYRLNIDDPALYDAVVNLDTMSAAEGAQVVQGMLQQKRFTPMTFSLQCTDNLTLSCKVRSMLSELLSDAEVKSHGGTVYVYSKRLRRNRDNIAEKIKADLLRIENVHYVEVFGERGAFDSVSCGQ